MATWSGTFTNESFIGPGTYQAKNGIRAFIDLTAGPVTVEAPINPEPEFSYIIAWDSPNRHDLILSGVQPTEDPEPTTRILSASVSLPFRRGVIGLTFHNGVWEVFNWSTYGVSANICFAAAWKGQATNGLCQVVNNYKIIEVERTGVGLYTVRVNPSMLTALTVVNPAFRAVGLPAENSAEMLSLDIGSSTPGEVLLNVGLRNKNGQFDDDDLLQDPDNLIACYAQQFP